MQITKKKINHPTKTPHDQSIASLLIPAQKSGLLKLEQNLCMRLYSFRANRDNNTF